MVIPYLGAINDALGGTQICMNKYVYYCSLLINYFHGLLFLLPSKIHCHVSIDEKLEKGHFVFSPKNILKEFLSSQML